MKRLETLFTTSNNRFYYSDKHAQYQTYLVAGMSSAYLKTSHKVKFLIEIENFTNQPLCFVKFQMKSGGYHNCPPCVILAGNKGSFSGRKASFALAGASGAVAYRIGDSAKVIVISFSCPLFPWSGGNTLALNFFEWDQSHIERMPRNSLYDQVHIEGPKKKAFIQGGSGKPLEVTDEALCDEGHEYELGGGMGVFPATEIKVSLLPTDDNKIATNLKSGFGVKEPKEEEVKKHEHVNVHCKLL